MDVTRVGVPVETRAPTGETNVYALGSGDALLVDPAGVSERLDGVVERRGVSHVAVTHHHPDHVGGVTSYAERYGATVWARTGREDDFAAATGVDPDRTFADGTVIPTGDGPVHVRDTPGHGPEHVAFLAGEDLVCGDLAVAEGSVAVTAPEGDVRAYLSSLRRVRATTPERLLPGHGPPVEGQAVCDTVERLLAHRLDRERRVERAVHDGRETPDAVCSAVYEKDISGVRDLAVATVVAHLEKLAVEGRVRWDGDRVLPGRSGPRSSEPT